MYCAGALNSVRSWLGIGPISRRGAAGAEWQNMAARPGPSTEEDVGPTEPAKGVEGAKGSGRCWAGLEKW